MMEIEKLLAKLEPLLPAKTAHWRRSLAIAEPDVRALLERQVRYTAHRILGDRWHRRILLSLPPEKTANRSLHLGDAVYAKKRHPFGISLRELTQHVAIFGRSGAGKSNVTFHLLTQLVQKKTPFLFIDWKRTARHLIPSLGKRLHVYTPGRKLSPFPFNPLLVPAGLERDIYVNHLVDVLSEAYTLGEGAKSILHRALADCYAQSETPSLQDVRAAVAAMETKERQSGWKISATRALESAKFTDSVARSSEDQQKIAADLLRGNTVLELDALSQSSKKFLIPLLCFWLYATQLAQDKRESLQFVIVLEEAHHTLYRQENRAKESLMNMLLRQGRELGIGFIVVDQHPHLISAASLGNCYSTICLNLKDPTDINKAAGMLLLHSDEKRYLSMLPVGQGIVKLQDRWRRPFVVEFPLVPINKGSVTDAVLRGIVTGDSHVQAGRERGGGVSDGGARSRLGDTPLSEGAVRLLHDVIAYPQDGVDRRYKRLGVSVAKGTRWKGQLLDNGLVRPERTLVGRSYRVLLQPTATARRFVLPTDGEDPRASLIHEFFKQWYAQQFRAAGYRVTVEAPRTRGHMDLLAVKDAVRVAVEVETGKSNVVWNVKQDLLAGCSRVIVVATDEAARQEVERRLAAATLLMPQRVWIVLRETSVEDL